IFAAARVFGVPTGASIELALLLAQAGEFAFVVLGLARGHGLLPPALATGAVAVVGLSMMVTPLLAILGRRASQKLSVRDDVDTPPGAAGAEFEDHVVIGGFGRVGQTIAQLLENESVPFVALDANSTLVKDQRGRGRNVYFGDAGRADILEHAGARRARAFVV